MRYVDLTESEILDLTELYENGPKCYLRERAQCLLLSDKGESIPRLACLFSTRTHTVRDWMNRWEAEGIKGLWIRPGRGLKPSIDAQNEQLVSSSREQIALHPQDLSGAVDRLNKQWGTVITVKQLRTFLKKS